MTLMTPSVEAFTGFGWYEIGASWYRARIPQTNYVIEYDVVTDRYNISLPYTERKWLLIDPLEALCVYMDVMSLEG